MRPLGPGAVIADGVRVLGHLHRSNRLDVYDAWCERRGCRVVAKTLRPDRRAERPAVRALLREGRLLRRLAHPHLVRAYEVSESPRPVVVMETLTGETLEHLVHDGRPLSRAEVGVLGGQLAAVLGYLHSEGVLHLDLKPANVIAESGRAKLIDLSHARPAGRMRPGGGTWCYMAPEQARGGLVEAPADVWGLGVVLYEAWSGTAPLREIADELDVDHPQLHARIPPVRSARRGLPPALSDVLDACLAPEPADRPSLADVARACDGSQ